MLYYQDDKKFVNVKRAGLILKARELYSQVNNFDVGKVDVEVVQAITDGDVNARVKVTLWTMLTWLPLMLLPS